MDRPVDYALICLSLEEVTMHADHKVFIEVDDNIALIVGDPQGILGQQLWPRSIDLLNIIMIILIISYY
jgi:hypothetical protein